MNAKSLEVEWKAQANAEYQKALALIIGLATGSLVLPIFFLREFAGVPQDKPLLPVLNAWVFGSWILLVLCILLGVIFHYVSAKWLKLAHGGPVRVSEVCLERILDWTFWLSVASFFLGGAALVAFLVSYVPTS
jgi:hypothetical protein